MTFVTSNWTQIFDTSEPRTLGSRVCYFWLPIAALDRSKIPIRYHQKPISKHPDSGCFRISEIII